MVSRVSNLTCFGSLGVGVRLRTSQRLGSRRLFRTGATHRNPPGHQARPQVRLYISLFVHLLLPARMA